MSDADTARPEEGSGEGLRAGTEPSASLSAQASAASPTTPPASSPALGVALDAGEPEARAAASRPISGPRRELVHATPALAADPDAEPDAWAAARRVLAVRLDAMGDVLMTAPALAALKGKGLGGAGLGGAGRHLALLTSPAGAEAARLIAAVDEVIVHAPPWMKAPGPADPSADLALVETLRAGAYEAAAIFTVHSQSPLPAALMCHLAGIPLRLAHCRENPYRLLTTWVRETEPARRLRHEARRQLDLVAAVGLAAPDERARLSIPEGARAGVEHRLRHLGLVHGGPWAVVHPGASAPSRRYPASAFARVVRTLAERHGWRILVTGSAEEQALAARVARGPGALSLAGDLDLAHLAALIDRAPVVVTNNTGPAHLAAALGTPVVDLYALTNLQHAPWRAHGRVLFHDVPCRVCLKSVCPEGHHLCLRAVPPEAVVAAAREAMAGRAPAIPEDPAALFGPEGLRRGADEARDPPAAPAERRAEAS